jgi:hypothetical protein
VRGKERKVEGRGGGWRRERVWEEREKENGSGRWVAVRYVVSMKVEMDEAAIDGVREDRTERTWQVH